MRVQLCIRTWACARRSATRLGMLLLDFILAHSNHFLFGHSGNLTFFFLFHICIRHRSACTTNHIDMSVYWGSRVECDCNIIIYILACRNMWWVVGGLEVFRHNALHSCLLIQCDLNCYLAAKPDKTKSTSRRPSGTRKYHNLFIDSPILSVGRPSQVTTATWRYRILFRHYTNSQTNQHKQIVSESERARASDG